jgi:DeoR family transcriptional regulator of aga operon
MAEAALADLQADRLFLGADGLDPERGVMRSHPPEAQLNARMIEISRQVVAVADSSKLIRRNISLIARVEQLHMLITDSGADPGVVAELERRGLEVRLAWQKRSTPNQTRPATRPCYQYTQSARSMALAIRKITA